jgi:hypothetical protein
LADVILADPNQSPERDAGWCDDMIEGWMELGSDL